MQLLTDPTRVASLFRGWEETPIWSCLAGTMGQVYAAGPTAASAVAVLGDFAFYAGKPSAALVRFQPPAPATILVPQTPAWGALIARHWGRQVQPFTRYATAKPGPAFDRAWLTQLAQVAPPDQLVAMDAATFAWCRRHAWSRDFVGQFADFDQFRRLAAGVLVRRGERIVAGASAYSAYPGGIEIEVDTLPGMRRQGLATAAAAQLILTCLARGLYPSWDAHNLASLGLAQKLGYQAVGAYPAFLRQPPTP